MQPINYLAAAPQTDFLRNIQGGLQIGQMFRQGQREEEAFAAQQQQLQAQQAAQQAYQADVSAAMANPTPAGIRALALKYPQHGKVYTELLSGLSGEQRTAALGDTASLAAALSGGRTDVASRLIDQRIEAMRTRGEQTADVEALRDAIKTDPQKAYGHALSLLAGFGEDGSKVLETLGKARTQPLTERKAAADAVQAEGTAAITAAKVPFATGVAASEATKASAEAVKSSAEAGVAGELARLSVSRSRAEINNINSQITERGKRLALDDKRLAIDIAEKLGTLPTTKLDPTTKKAVDDAVTASAVATQAASGMDALAAKFDAQGGGWGALSAGAELFKKATGTQGTMSLLRNEYARIRNSIAIKNLPAGSASDADVAMALQGMPGDNASSDVISSFLRGMAKLSRIDAEVSSAKAEWISSNGALVASKKPLSVAGIDVAAGTKFEAVAEAISRRGAAGEKPAAPVAVNSDADFDALPSGALFTAPDGTTRRKP